MSATQLQRKSFTPSKEKVELDNLIEHQHKSWELFVKEGLQETFEEINPINDYTDTKLELSFKDYHFEAPKITEREARENNTSYEAPLKVNVELINKVTGEVKESEIYLGDYPWMTSRGTFIVNGAERVVVSQLIRSAGVFFTSDFIGTRNFYGAKVIPGRGAWLEFETSPKGELFVKIDRKRKLPVTTLLRALGYSTAEELKEVFADVDTGEHSYIDATLAKDPAENTADALIEVYRRLRPGDLATVENAKTLIETTFFSYKRFDFSPVGRYKMNKRLQLDVPNNKANRIMRLDDLVAIVKELVRLNNTQEPADDIDSLSNRRVRLVGELVQRQFRVGLLRMERNVKDRMSMAEIETVAPGQLVNARPVVAAVREFFASSQLSQFMDQINPLGELSNKRRLSSMGPGGLTRERAGLEVRDVHRTHYGRICAVETPEGAPIGLVLNLASFARINDYGFLETPYLKVINKVGANEAAGHVATEDVLDNSGKLLFKIDHEFSKSDESKLAKLDQQLFRVKPRVTDEIVYVDASDEERSVIAEANVEIDKNGNFVEARVPARIYGKTGESDSNRVDYIDASPKQIIGVTASLVPFMERDRADRALTGSNQQRQAVPLIQPQAPIVGTGMEAVVARNSGQLIVAEQDGVVEKATGAEVIVKYKDGSKRTYEPLIFVRSNEGTCITQRVVVENGQKLKKNDIIVEGMSIDKGELALGRNMRVAFMPWGGYNFEDAIIVSEKVVEDDAFSSISIEDFMIEVRETKLGPEVVTRDIPNVSEDSLRHLDDEGIVRLGAEVGPGDILIGKITPKGEQELSSEERLLRAIFGEKAKDVRDTSTRMPTGKHGKVVGVKIFSRDAGHELKAGVIMQIQVFVAQMRKLQVGDKMGGRHGNKGVISRILPVEDMPFDEDGTPVDVVLNPLGVPSRMNIGQLFETHLGLAANALGYHAVSPAFRGVTDEEIRAELKAAGLPEDGKTQLYDGRTGESFNERTTVGYMYMIKLNHMVTDKIHARSTGPYAMVTQQPLGGKAQNGGQRFGEMEVWALEAHGVANMLQEMLTIKSDDVLGRSKAYESIIKSEEIHGPRVPESFNVLTKEFQSLGLDVHLISKDIEIDAEELLEANINQPDNVIVQPIEAEVDVTSDKVADEFKVLDDNSDSDEGDAATGVEIKEEDGDE